MDQKILLVDDEPDVLDVLETLLTAEGFRIRKTSKGRHAIEICRSESFDLVITDIRMPEIDGLGVVKELKHLDQDVEIIVLTGFATIDNAIEALRDGGAFDFLRKPLENLDEFFHTIYQALEKRRLRIQNRMLVEELKRHRDHLEDLVRTRTTALTKANEQLRQEIAERKQIEKEHRQLETQLRRSQKLEAVGTLAGGIAHDFNNILAMMLGYIELLLEEYAENDETRDYLRRAYRVGERATELVRQILTFSRMQEQPRLTPTNIAPIIKESLKMIRATTPTNIDIRQHIPTYCPSILADATQIHQMLVNLCVNATHAMREKGGILDISVEEVNDDGMQAHLPDVATGSYLKLTISDTGCGMTSEVQEHIFEPFFTTKDVDEGTGLGLSVVHGIIKGHHGAITVTSKQDTGTTFQIVFPITDEIELQEEPTRETSARKRKGHILLVEDEPDLVNLYELALTKFGYRVTALTDSSEALNLFRANPDQFDLICTDQTMPIMTGEQLSQELLNMRPKLPIILMTGYSHTISKAKAKALGIRQFLMKPVKIRILVQTIQKILE